MRTKIKDTILVSQFEKKPKHNDFSSCQLTSYFLVYYLRSVFFFLYFAATKNLKIFNLSLKGNLALFFSFAKHLRYKWYSIISEKN